MLPADGSLIRQMVCGHQATNANSVSGLIALFATLFSSPISGFGFPVLGVADQANALYKCLAQLRHLS